ncbi:hypothetical protein K7G98_08855 [Saccharothrix sp. MB29]|nr:hypothetical protein [Saccharothrix sp. MB29]
MANSPGSLGDRDHEGHLAGRSRRSTPTSPPAAHPHPRTILPHIGTNDIYGSNPAARRSACRR